MISSNQLTVIKEHLFSSVEEMKKAKVPAPTQERLLRIRDMYNYMLQYPRLEDKDIVLELRTRYKVCQSVAYEDLRVIKVCLGTFNQVTKDYDRYYFRQRAIEGFEMARQLQDANAYAKVLAAYGKFTQLDKEVLESLSYSDIVPSVMVPSDDPRVVGMKPIKNVREIARKLHDKYSRRTAAQEADFEEVKEE